MPIQVIDKIKQKNDADFKLLDFIDIHGRITGWQNPVKQIFATVGDISGMAVGDTFIVRNAGGTWSQFAGKDIYNRDAIATDNAIYVLGEAVDGEAEPVYLVAAPETGMVLVNLAADKLQKYGGVTAAWTDLPTGSGTVEGKTLRHEAVMQVDTSETVDQNYEPATGQLDIGYEIQPGESVKIYVNGLKYTHMGTDPDYSYTPGNMYLTWDETNAGFDLETGDEIIIEIFN